MFPEVISDRQQNNSAVGFFFFPMSLVSVFLLSPLSNSARKTCGMSYFRKHGIAQQDIAAAKNHFEKTGQAYSAVD